jgi:hypothetical protein
VRFEALRGTCYGRTRLKPALFPLLAFLFAPQLKERARVVSVSRRCALESVSTASLPARGYLSGFWVAALLDSIRFP